MAETKSNPTVSIIIPTYNRVCLVERAVRSVLNQTYQEFELIVVDDGSDDDTPKVVKSFKDKRIRYIRHQENKGGSTARNSGIKVAKGQFIAFLDDDDEWLSEKLEKQIVVLEKLSEEWGVVYTGRYEKSKGGDETIQLPGYSSDIYRQLFLGCFIGGSTTLVRHSCFDKIGLFDESLLRHQDWDIFIRIAKHYKFAFIEEPLVITHLTGLPNADDVEKSKRIFLRKFSEEIYSQPYLLRRRIYAKHWLKLAELYLTEQKADKASFYLLKTVIQCPFCLSLCKYCLTLYIRVIDTVLGTRLSVTLSKLKKSLLGH